MDPISDMFSQITNGLKSKKNEVVTSSSNFKKAILEIFKKFHCIETFSEEKKTNNKVLIIKLKYNDDIPAISAIKRLSKPGLRRYRTADALPRLQRELGLILISTNKGILTAAECKKLNIGGEIICEIRY